MRSLENFEYLLSCNILSLLKKFSITQYALISVTFAYCVCDSENSIINIIFTKDSFKDNTCRSNDNLLEKKNVVLKSVQSFSK